MKDREIAALIKLLEDKDEEVFKIVAQKLIEKGTDAVSDLEKAWENSLNQFVQVRIETLIHDIQFHGITSELKEWVEKGGENLLYGVFLIAKYQYPDLIYSEIEERIDILRRDIWIEMHDNLTALEKVRVINHIMFSVHKYTGNISNFYSPGNSYINQVLESKKGNPISLSVIYATIAQGLGLPVYGVNLPLNYVLAYVDPIFDEDPDGILFYINPYNKGSFISRKELEFFLTEQKFNLQPEYFRPCSNIKTLERILKNLHFSYERMGYQDKTYQIDKLLEIVEKIDKA